MLSDLPPPWLSNVPWSRPNIGLGTAVRLCIPNHRRGEDIHRTGLLPNFRQSDGGRATQNWYLHRVWPPIDCPSGIGDQFVVPCICRKNLCIRHRIPCIPSSRPICSPWYRTESCHERCRIASFPVWRRCVRWFCATQFHFCSSENQTLCPVIASNNDWLWGRSAGTSCRWASALDATPPNGGPSLPGRPSWRSGR